VKARILGLAFLVLLGCLSACRGSVPPRTYTVCMSPRPCFDQSKDPYWEDPVWQKSLLDAIQSAVHDPVDPADMSTYGLHATVKFTFLDGVVEYPEIVHGTGDPEKDGLMLHQLSSAQLPKPRGLQPDQAHEFVLDVDMPTPFESFQSSVYGAIENWKVYPKDPIISGTTGNTTVDFDYLDGKSSGITMVRSSKDKMLDQASLGAATRAVFPSAPPAYAGKTLHMEVVFCYTIQTASEVLNDCPNARNVIVVHGTRIVRRQIQAVPTGPGYR
jgi:hypothetical protein